MRNFSVILTAILLIFLLSSASSSTAEERRRCLPGISKFSASGSKDVYFECDGDGLVPVKKYCGVGEVYSMKRQRCVNQDDTEEVVPMDIEALGRNFQLGSMYDARTGMFFPERPLWSKNTTLHKKETSNQFRVNVDVKTADRLKERVNLFDISAELAVDFMGGMVKVWGAGGYLNEEVSSEEESNVQLTFSTTKYSETLSQKTWSDTMECKPGMEFTHAVTSVTYGLNAVFSFKRMTQNHEDKQNITGQLKVTIDSIGAEGSGSVEIDEWTKEVFETTTLEVYGDFSPEKKLPNTFEQAVEFYQELPTMAGTKDEKWPEAQIVKAHLTPIVSICDENQMLYNAISEGMLESLVDTLDKLKQLEVKVNGLIISNEAAQFMPLQINLKTYRSGLRNYTIEFKTRMQEILPNIRDTTKPEGEDDIIDLLTEYNNSPFNFDTSSNFLTNRSRELMAIRYLIETVKGTSVVVADFEEANDVQNVFGKESMVMLELNILSNAENTKKFLNGEEIQEDYWYNDQVMNGKIGSLMRSLRNFANANSEFNEKSFMVKLNEYNNDEPFVLNAVLKGFMMSTAFVNPPAPSISTLLDRTSDGFVFKILHDNEFVKQISTTVTDLIENRNHTEVRDVQNDTVGQEVEVNIKGLKPGHLYSYTVQYVTDLGIGPSSAPLVAPFNTRATSQPQKLTILAVTRDQITVEWASPNKMTTNATSSQLSYKVVVRGSNNFYMVKITSKMNFTLSNPEADTWYTFEISSVLNRDLFTEGSFNSPVKLNVTAESNPESITVSSLPLPPKMKPLPAEEVQSTSALVQWESILAPDTVLKHYVVEYNTMNEVGNETNIGSDNSEKVVDETQLQLSGLTPGTLHNVRVKTVTENKGSSDFSSSLLFLTTFDASDIEDIKENITGMIDEIEKVIVSRVSICGWWTKAGIDEIYVNDNNKDSESEIDSNGVFHAGTPGVYQVSLGISAETPIGMTADVYVTKNGEDLDYSQNHFMNDVNTFSTRTDHTSRNVIVDLKKGDTIGIHAVDSSDAVTSSVPFCISSLQI